MEKPQFSFLLFIPLIIFSLLVILGTVFVFLTPMGFHLVLSDSMAPAYYTGDILLVNGDVNYEDLSVGATIIYQRPTVDYVVHRIIAKKEVNNSYYFAVKGDFNDQPDIVPPAENTFLESLNFTIDGKQVPIQVTYFHQNLIIGEVTGHLPLVGWIWVRFSTFFFPITFIGFVIIAGYVGLRVYSLYQDANSSFEYFYQEFKNRKEITFTIQPIMSVIFAVLLISVLSVGLISLINPTVTCDQTVELETDNFSHEEIFPSASYKEIAEIEALSVLYRNVSRIDVQIINTDANSTSVMFNRTIQIQEYDQTTTTLTSSDTRSESFQLTLDSHYRIQAVTPMSSDVYYSFWYLVPSPRDYILAEFLYIAVVPEEIQINGVTYKALKGVSQISFIQELYEYNGEVTFWFDELTGFLLKKESHYSLSPWTIPDVISTGVIAVIAIFSFWRIRESLHLTVIEKIEKLLPQETSEEVTTVMDTEEQF